jgi:hypothetical protein
MTGRDGTKGNTQSRNAKKRRRQVAIVGAGAGAFLAAAAMATGSAAPAKADLDDLLDPIIQPLITSLSDAIAGFDPAAATDVTSWTDSLLNSLNSIDLALPSTAEPAASVASAASSASDPTSGTYDIPITVQEGTEPTVNATVDGQPTTLLADTGSSGLVIPWQDLGSNELTDLFKLGFPTGFGFSGYSGGVDYFYLTYDTTVDYGGGLDTSNTPVDVEIFSFPTSSTAPANFEQFLSDDDVSGILGVGDYQPGFFGIGAEAGPTESPLEAAGFDGVTVDVPQGELIVSSSATNPGTAIDTLSGAPTPTQDLTEVVTNSAGQTVGSATVSADIDSGGVFGTIPSSIGSVPDGDTITVESGGTVLYSYVVGSSAADGSPSVVSGDSIDSGFAPYAEEPIFIDYSNDSIAFDDLLS